jgi:hypothetical protein
MTDFVGETSRLRSSRLARLRSIGVIIGLAASLVWIGALFGGKQTKFEELAIGEASVKFDTFEGQPIHCHDFRDLGDCVHALEAQHPQDVLLWLGNSQLHAINQFQPGDKPASSMMHQKLREQKRYLLTASQPNADLQEHLVLFAHLLPLVKPKVLLLPVVFDDLRETGVRTSLAAALDDPATDKLLLQSEIGRRLLQHRQIDLKRGSSGGDLDGLRDTLQERSESWLTGQLEQHWPLWAARSEARGKMMEWLYELRNWVFGIKPTTIRKMIQGRYVDNWAALEAIVRLAQANDVLTYIYIPPLRDDAPRPYNSEEYAAFKARLFAEFGKAPKVVVTDLEGVVPNIYWGNLGIGSDGQPVLDFMHFQARGHEHLANALLGMLDTQSGVKP